MSFTLKPVFALGAERQLMARNPGDIRRFTEPGVQARRGFVHSVFSWMKGTKPKVFLSKSYIVHDALHTPSCRDSFRCDAGAGPQESAPSPTP